MFELSRNANTVLPLMVCVFIADALMRLLDENSMMTDKLAKRGLVVTQDYVAPTFQLWNMNIDQVMEPLPADAEALQQPHAPGVIRVHQGDSIAPVAHRLIEEGAEQALVLNEEDKPIGWVRIADILALEDERVRHHDLRERQTK